MSDIEAVVKAGIDGLKSRLDAAIEKHDGQLMENGKASSEALAEVRALANEFKSQRDRLLELEQKQVAMPAGPAQAKTWGDQFTESEAFKSLVNGQRDKVRVSVKSTTVSDGVTVFPFQKPGVIPGSFVPLTVRAAMRSIPVSTNAVEAIREASWTNSAAEVSEGAAKPESDITFERYDVNIRTIAHWLKVSKNLLADAPAIAAYIDTRARDGLAQRVDRQLIQGNGTSPNLSGLTDSGNFTAYTPTSDDNLADAINRIKYTMWAAGNTPDTVFVNPADWGTLERLREGANSGTYLYGMPGSDAGMNPFGLRVVLTPYINTGKLIVAQLSSAALIYDRQAPEVELGYVNDDFTKNLVTIRVEERLGFGVERPIAVYYGDYTA